MMQALDKCYFCGTTKGIKFCSLCKKSFCNKCRRQYARRVEAMANEAVDRVMRSLRRKGKVTITY